MVEISTLGALIGLVTAIWMIFKKVNPVYAMIGGAFVGGIIGGATITETVDIVVHGAQSIVPAVLRVLTVGVFAGVLIETGAADKIAETIIQKLGEEKALMAIILSSCIICAVGVIIPVTIITVAPIALIIAKRAKLSKASILIAMLGGGKSGNIMSPNPNAIAIADGFKIDLSMSMLGGIIPAIFGIIITYIIAKKLAHKGDVVVDDGIINEKKKLPSFKKAIVGPLFIIIMLALNSIFILNIDPMIILPLGGLIAAISMGEICKFKTYMSKGLLKMKGAAILLLGTGTIAGIISQSTLSDDIINIINYFGISGILLASISGILMGGATASITGGAVVTSSVFSNSILHMGVNPVAATEMVHTGVSVIDDLPHGNLFHISAESVSFNIKQRAKLIPYEILIGLAMNIVATMFYGFIIN
ncbi:GntP family permease [Clostridium botulinum C]|uniref:GntP family permease n=2 Tax=Clostridium botulinum TaxID=1491 RepID=A0A9Q4TH87_CLOBO|nr:MULTISPECIES: GntP family permease [Clostridium]KEI10734.1 gluconate:proton symporter [Clostridium sp. K25]MCD3194022.1 GntP family permease [Clostridium botulinum C]MCD3199349.1 GntP family permease [Clostridium botulinum C]MCD3204824.1 GntP family permease [Clostridium botulinum C]MCD3207649.1 GntP family permease [Clostridium botulinum C]